MKKLSFASFGELMESSPAINLIWQNASNEIVGRALQVMPVETQKKLGLSKEQIEQIGDGKNAPTELMVPLLRENANGKDLKQAFLLSIARSALEKDKAEKEGESLPHWEALLRLLWLAFDLEFNHPWLESEDSLAEFINSKDKEDLDRCNQAYDFLSASREIIYFNEEILPSFYKAISANLEKVNNKVESIEDYEQVCAHLLAAADEKKKFTRYARALKRELNGEKLGPVLKAIKEDIFTEDILTFIKRLTENIEAFKTRLREEAAAILPEVFDVSAMRELLEKVQPPIYAHDMKLLLEELDDIKEKRLSRKKSQLIHNILPALQKQKGFDTEAFDKASDEDFTKALSYKFIRSLSAGKFAIPEAPGQKEEIIEASVIEGDDKEAIAEASLPLEQSIEQSNEEVIEDLVEPQKPREDAGMLRDGFEIFEDNLSAPPQPEEEEKHKPETMTLEQAWALSQQESQSESKDADKTAPGKRKN